MLDFDCLSWFLQLRTHFPPSTTTRCLSSAPSHAPAFLSVGFWDQSWGLWQGHAPGKSIPAVDGKGWGLPHCCGWAAGTQEVIVCLAALPPAWGQTLKKWFPLGCWVSWQAKQGWLFLGRELCGLYTRGGTHEYIICFLFSFCCPFFSPAFSTISSLLLPAS